MHNNDNNNNEATQTLLYGTAEVRKAVKGSVWTELWAEISGDGVIWNHTEGMELVLIEGEMIEV